MKDVFSGDGPKHNIVVTMRDWRGDILEEFAVGVLASDLIPDAKKAAFELRQVMQRTLPASLPLEELERLRNALNATIKDPGDE